MQKKKYKLNLIKPWLALAFACSFFIISTILIKILAGQDSFFSLFHHFATISRFFYIFILIVIGAKLAKQIMAKKESATIESNNNSTSIDEDITNIVQSPKQNLEEISQEESSEKTIQDTLDQNNSSFDPELQNIPQKPHTKHKAQKNDNMEFSIKLVYLVLLFTFIAFFTLYNAIAYPFLTKATNENSSILNIVLLLIIMLGAFVLRKWIILKNDDDETEMLSGLLLIYEGLILVTLFFNSLLFIFKLNYIFILSWIYWFSFFFIVLSLLFAITKSIIKKQIIDDFNYAIVPFGKNGEDGLLKTIEKNTGLSFKSLWSLKYLISIIPVILLSIVLLLFVSTSVYKVEPYQKGIVYRFGSIQQEVVSPGLHLKFPFPIDEVEIFDVERVQNMQIGYIATESNDFLWTQEHDGGEHSLLLGNGNELVSVNISLIYNINDLYAFAKKHSAPENILSAKAYELMMEKTISNNLDTVLCVARKELSANIKAALNSYATELHLGLAIKEVIIESIHPPVEIADVYQNAVSAGIDKNIKIIKAQTQADKKLIEAEGTSGVDILDAQALQTERIAQSKYEMAVYYAAFDAFEINPNSFSLSKYLNTYEKVIEGSKVYVFSPSIDADLSEYWIDASNGGAKNAANNKED